MDVCGECGYVIEKKPGFAICSYECRYDTEFERPKIIHAVWQRTDVFVRDEVEEDLTPQQNCDTVVNEPS